MASMNPLAHDTENSSAPLITHIFVLAAAVFVFMVLTLVLAQLPFEYNMAVTLGIVQGLGEFLPISSSAHLILTPWFFGWPDPGLTFDVALHVGTLVAVVVYFWRDWFKLVGGAIHPRSGDGRLFWLLMVGAVPGAVAGLLLNDLAEAALRNPLLIAGTLTAMGLLLLAADYWGARNRETRDIGWADALVIGSAQALAIIPGVSRSGITIAAARIRGIEREAAARFSFLLGTPIIAGAALFKLRHIFITPSAITGPFVTGIVVAGVVGALTIGMLLRYVQRAGLGIFVLYRVLLALVVLATVIAGTR